MYTLTQTKMFAGPLIDYNPQDAGFGGEPAVSIGTDIKQTIGSAPLVWPWNRAEITPFNTVVGQQDYTVATTDFGFLEKATLTDSNGVITEVKSVSNLQPMSKSGGTSRPQTAYILESIPHVSVLLRFSSPPQQIYAVNMIYQKALPIMGPFLISAAANAAAGNTAYTGQFIPASFPTGATAVITGFVAHTVNNGSFVVVSCTANTLTVANAAGVAETIQAYASNFDWAPVPDSYRFIYNTLYLAEMFALVDDPRAQQYRMRGIGALLAKQEGLSETEKNVFMQQYLMRGADEQVAGLRIQQGNAARAT